MPLLFPWSAFFKDLSQASQRTTLGQKKYKEGDTKQDEGNTILVLPNTIGVKLMRVTTKGQVTIPRNIRETLGIMPETEVDFKEENGRYYIVKSDGPKESKKFKKLRGIATANMSTDEIMSLIRGY